jgi:hypothetical protein
MVRNNHSKRRFSYQEQTLLLTGHKTGVYSPVTKQARIQETLNHLSSARYIETLVTNLRGDLKGYEEITGASSSSGSDQDENDEQDEQDDSMDIA